MGDMPRKIDVEKLISYSNDLVEVLKDKKDLNGLTQCLDHSKSLHSSCEADFNSVLNSIQDYEKRLKFASRKQSGQNLKLLLKLKWAIFRMSWKRSLKKNVHSRRNLDKAISNEIKDLERQRIVIEEQKRACKKSEQGELRAQMKLSMYASVTNIIPNLDDQSKISGYIVDRDKNVIKKFKYDPAKQTTYDTCDNIWKTINL